MIFNQAMGLILETISMDTVQLQAGGSIWQKRDEAGQPYWGVGNFCGLDETPVKGELDLTALEWSGNEVYVNHSTDILDLVTYGLGIVFAWKKQMEQRFAHISFDIALSVDTGDVEISPSATVRFWAVRNGEHYITPNPLALEKFSQPVLMEQVNHNL